MWTLNLYSVVENKWNWHPISYPKSIFQNSTMNSGISQEFQKNWNLQIQSAKLSSGTKIKWKKHPTLSNLTKYVPFRRNSTWNFQNSGKSHKWPKVHKIILNLTLYFVFQNFCNKSPFWMIFFRSPLDLRKTAHGKKTTSLKGGLTVKIWFRDLRESF